MTPDTTAGPNHQHQVQDDVKAVPDEQGEGEDNAMVSYHSNAVLQSVKTRLCYPELLICS